MSILADTPGVSVVMSVYNGASHLKEAINSILHQTMRNFEFILVNDGSTDDSSEILQRYQEHDSRIRIIDQENQGLTKALIHGCDAARGRFIARQDADDWSHPDRLQKQIDALNSNPDLAFVSCWAEGITTEGRPLEVMKRPADIEQATHGLRFHRQGPPAHGTVMFPAEIYRRVGGYRPQFYFSQDSDLWLRMAEVGSVMYLQEVLYRYRRDVGSLSSAKHDVQYEFGEIGQACNAIRENGGDETELLHQADQLTKEVISKSLGLPTDQRRIDATAYLIGSQLARNGDRSAMKYLWSVVRHRPWHFKAWIRLGQAATGVGRSRSSR